MARQEQDREDLLAEARALVERVELRCAGFAEHVIAGFRRDGCASFYFGPNLAYHFNTRGQLRRAYDHGRLLKADRGKLAALSRQRTAWQVQLLRHDLDRAESREFLERADANLQNLTEALSRGEFDVIGRVPCDADGVGRVRQWLIQWSRPTAVAEVPEVG